jgi:hypothetical protein
MQSAVVLTVPSGFACQGIKEIKGNQDPQPGLINDLTETCGIKTD